MTYAGRPVVTYFFASSGGYTENIENVWTGSTPEPWLKGVPDPYDGAGNDPYHRWTQQLSLAAATAKLGSLVRGSLLGIAVTAHGASPRILQASVVGTRGTSPVTGAQLQSIFGLATTNVAFTTVSTTGVARQPAGDDLPRFERRRRVGPGARPGGAWQSVHRVPLSVAASRPRSARRREHHRDRAGTGPVPDRRRRPDRSRRHRLLSSRVGSGLVPGPLLAIDGPFVLYRSFFALPDSITGAGGHPVNALLGADQPDPADRRRPGPAGDRRLLRCRGRHLPHGPVSGLPRRASCRARGPRPPVRPGPRAVSRPSGGAAPAQTSSRPTTCSARWPPPRRPPAAAP